MKKRRFGETRDASTNRDTKQREVGQIMRKNRGIRSWSYMIAIAVALIGMSLFLVQVAGAANYTITVTQSPNGTITTTAPGLTNNVATVLGGTDKPFTITPNLNYAISSLTVDGTPVHPAKTYKFTKVSANHRISATFAPDADNDGIPDNLETQAPGITVLGFNYPPCGQGVDRPKCVDPASKDVFVVLVPAQGGYFSALTNPLEYVTKSVGGLPINVHLIVLSEGFSDTGDRFLDPHSAEKYVRITESLVPTPDPLVFGSSSVGTPDVDLGTVYTKKIENNLISVFSTSGVPPDIILTYIKHTIAHEFGHMVGPLAPVYNPNYGGNHYASAANDQIMNQSVYVTGSGISAVFYIGTSYTSTDQAGIKLK